MFSKTGLGLFLRNIYSGSYPELMQKESALALAALLLADESITQNLAIQNELRDALAMIYGDGSIWKYHEAPVDGAVYSKLLQILTEVKSSGHIKAVAYITGLLGAVDESPVFTNYRRFQLIHLKMLRIFHGQHYNLPPLQGTNLFIGIIGLKGSGKSSVLHFLKEKGEDILEVYEELDHIRNECEDKFAFLPPRKDWEDEPLQLVLRRHGVTAQTRYKIFFGSLLRYSEIKLLSKYGRVILIYLESPNTLRHARIKNRGRKIEKMADQAWLIELDAHRDGLWPTYEQNDLGGLVDICSHTITNDLNISPAYLYEQISDIVRKDIL